MNRYEQGVRFACGDRYRRKVIPGEYPMIYTALIDDFIECLKDERWIPCTDCQSEHRSVVQQRLLAVVGV